VLRRELHDRIKADGAGRKIDATEEIGSEAEIPTVS
jgi:hypothetical protein